MFIQTVYFLGKYFSTKVSRQLTLRKNFTTKAATSALNAANGVHCRSSWEKLLLKRFRELFGGNTEAFITY